MGPGWVLTRQGWLVGLGGVGLIVFGRLLGVRELYGLGAAALALLVLATTAVAITKLRLEVGRELYPPRVHAGTLSRVELRVRNVGLRRTPVLKLLDPVSGTRGAELLLGPLEPQGTARAAYRLPTDKRGVLKVGPLEVIVADPFGLTSVATAAAPRTELTVFPRVDDIVRLPHTTGHDPHAGADHPNALGRTGEDFYALRPYEVGDDLRRVHWPSTARHDELMVRQDELPWQGRATVVLDVRRSTHTAPSLELAVSAAASVVTVCWRRRDLVRLLSTDGADSGFAAGHAHIEAIMEHLAVVQPTPGGTLRGALDALRRSGAGGNLVVIVANLAQAELDTVAQMSPSFGALTVIQFDRSSWDPAAPVPTPVPGPNVLRVTRDRPFVVAWNQAMSRRGGVAGRPPTGTTVPGVRS
jgi:uncharacterized protein (DUF58 family)